MCDLYANSNIYSVWLIPFEFAKQVSLFRTATLWRLLIELFRSPLPIGAGYNKQVLVVLVKRSMGLRVNE
jgi:hypothetical protein